MKDFFLDLVWNLSYPVDTFLELGDFGLSWKCWKWKEKVPPIDLKRVGVHSGWEITWSINRVAAFNFARRVWKFENYDLISRKFFDTSFLEEKIFMNVKRLIFSQSGLETCDFDIGQSTKNRSPSGNLAIKKSITSNFSYSFSRASSSQSHHHSNHLMQKNLHLHSKKNL